ncbi:MAG: hypothetical protein AB4050_04115 [Synechococcus sp.]
MVTESTAFQQAATYVLKLAVLTLVISVAIKYGGPYLHVPNNSAIALALVLLPATIVVIRLFILRTGGANHDAD